MDGAFFRAFDYSKWEAWASDADIGWGAWSVESGWTQSWITTVLGLRLLNTTLWDLGSSEVFGSIRSDFDAWIPVMFPPPPPPPPPTPPTPCDPPLPCIPAGHNATIHFTLVTSQAALCAPAPGSAVSHVVYTGRRCGGKGSKAIQWESMRTLDPRPGAMQCSWSEQAGSPWTGRCGSCAESVRLPTEVC